VRQSRILQICGLLCTAVLLQAFVAGAQPVIKIAAGASHSLFLKSDGSLWAMGQNNAGQLGDGTFNTDSPQGTNQPQLIVASNVTAIAADVGDGFSLFLKGDGSLWGMGANNYGALGDGTYNQTNVPEQILASNVTAIAAGLFHSLFLKGDGSLWATGDNRFGELGDGMTNTDYPYGTNRPQLIVSSNVTAIAAGATHSLFLKNDGSLWAMGDDGDGELGDGNSGGGNCSYVPEQIMGSNVTMIAASQFNSFFIKSDGSLWAVGAGSDGQLGAGTNYLSTPQQIVASNVTAVAAGWNHTLFLKNDGSLWGMGYNADGELGDGSYNNTNRPEQIVPANVTAIAAGMYHSLFLKSDGSLWAMGYNGFGEFGDGTFSNGTNRPEQVVVNPSYNRIYSQQFSGAAAQLYFFGNATGNYALDRSFTLVQPNWIPQVTNSANSFGALVFTNTPAPAMNNFWRVRAVQ
jgi:alpha-tubulin suppressor-like RCC1 family protein